MLALRVEFSRFFEFFENPTTDARDGANVVQDSNTVHRRFGTGENFKILGVTFDSVVLCTWPRVKLRRKLAGGSTRYSKLSAFSLHRIFQVVQGQVLAFIQSKTPGFYHAARSVLNRIDRAQRRFLRELGSTEVEALEFYRVAPLLCRTDMAMLRVLHKITFGIAPPQLAASFLCLVRCQSFFLQAAFVVGGRVARASLTRQRPSCLRQS